MFTLLTTVSCLVSLALGLTPTDNPAAGACLCANTAVKVYNSGAAACKNVNVLGTLSTNSCVKSGGAKVTACGYTWFKVLYNGADGWIAGQYLDSASSSRCSDGPNVPGLTQRCLDCICEVEGCKTGCHFDVNSLSCGYFQIKSGYYSDCGSPGSGWKVCADDKICATQCVENYMKRYGTFCTGGRTPTCQDYAKIHNGGPRGCQHTGAVTAYWNKVQACLARAG